MGHKGSSSKGSNIPKGWVADPRLVVATGVPRRSYAEYMAAPQLDLSSTDKMQQAIQMLGAVAVNSGPGRRRSSTSSSTRKCKNGSSKTKKKS